MKLFLANLLIFQSQALTNSSSDYVSARMDARLDDFTDIFPDDVECTLSNGNVLNAADWVCRTLDRAIERNPPEIPEPIENFACDPLPPLENGEVFCYDSWKLGTICMGVCKNGWILEPNKKKKCFAKNKWDKTKPGKSPVKWNFANMDFECVRDYLESPCLTNNGGCSHECIDKGDMIPICVCPCGHTLADDGKTCIDNQECPFDISLWLDGTTSSCGSAGYDEAQKATMANIADFFSVEVNTYDARIYAASYGNGRIQHEVSGWNFTSVSEIIDDIDVMPNNCAENIISNVFLEPNDRANDAATVAFVSMASQLRDSEEMITFNRPEADITIVMMEGDTATEQAMVQASILACNHDTPEVCTNIINLNEGMSAGDIETRVNREPCYKRNYASTIACGEFSMELDIPVCSLRGLAMEDMVFNSGKTGDCSPTMELNGTHYKWTIGYGDCGTTQTIDEDLGTVTFSNKMVTWIDQEAPVFPVVPEFDVDLTCVVSTKFEFVFHGDFYPELTSFRGVKNVAGTQTGNLQIFADSDFTTTWDGLVMDTGVDVFVQSNSTLVSSGQKLQVTDCVASPGEIVDLSSPSGAPIWPMIEAGCVLDETILILPRGPLDQVRFLFESFRFQGEISGAQINLQCRYKVCEADECPSLVNCASGTRKRKRRAAAPSRFQISPTSSL